MKIVVFQNRTEEVVDLNTDNNLQVDISDALSERDKVSVGFLWLV
jgi:hypothetical protein